MKTECLPKGMVLDTIQEREEKEPISLRRENYVAAIYQALSGLNVEIRVDECLIAERIGEMPEVKLILRIVGEKNADNNQ